MKTTRSLQAGRTSEPSKDLERVNRYRVQLSACWQNCIALPCGDLCAPLWVIFIFCTDLN